jgi:hypothetical protein
MRGSEESVRRECTYVLANPWAQTVGVSQEVAEGLLEAGLVQVGERSSVCFKLGDGGLL